jgi:hypothetical protein
MHLRSGWEPSNTGLVSSFAPATNVSVRVSSPTDDSLDLRIFRLHSPMLHRLANVPLPHPSTDSGKLLAARDCPRPSRHPSQGTVRLPVPSNSWNRYISCVPRLNAAVLTRGLPSPCFYTQPRAVPHQASQLGEIQVSDMGQEPLAAWPSPPGQCDPPVAPENSSRPRNKVHSSSSFWSLSLDVINAITGHRYQDCVALRANPMYSVCEISLTAKKTTSPTTACATSAAPQISTRPVTRDAPQNPPRLR